MTDPNFDFSYDDESKDSFDDSFGDYVAAFIGMVLMAGLIFGFWCAL